MTSQLTTIEKLLVRFGLADDGARIVAGVIIGSVLVWAIKPDFAWREGKWRKWKIANPTDIDATYVPFWVPPVIGGVVLGVLI